MAENIILNSSRVKNLSILVPIIYHGNYEEKNEPWDFPALELKGKIAPMDYDPVNNHYVRSLPFHLMIMVMRGSVEFTLGGRSYLAEENMLIHVPPFTFFHIRAVKLPMRYAWIHFKLWMPIQPNLLLPLTPVKEETMFSNQLAFQEGVIELDTLLIPTEYQMIRKLIVAMLEELLLEKPGWLIVSRSYLQAVLTLLYREMVADESHADKSVKDSNIVKAIEYIHRDYIMKISVEQLAREANLSLHYFIPRFKQITGYTPGEYIARIRINHAKKLIRSGEYSITEIAFLTGFESANYFSRVFRKFEGISPKEFKHRE